MSSRPRLRKRDTSEYQQRVEEYEIEITLSSRSAHRDDQVLYDFKSGQYQALPEEDLLIHLFTLPSRIIQKEQLELLQMEENSVDDSKAERKEERYQEQQLPQLHPEFPMLPQDVGQEMADLYGSIMSREDLAKLDSQPNPFNFSERVSQTLRVPMTNTAGQTDPPPSTTFCLNVGFSVIYDAYDLDYSVLLEKKRKELENANNKDKSKEKRNEKQVQKSDDPVGKEDPLTVFTSPLSQTSTSDHINFTTLLYSVRIIERMINQNLFDEIIQGNKSVLNVGGLLCLFSLKNPGVPERCLPTSCGLTSVHFHPTHESVVVAGRSDGAVMMFDARQSHSATMLVSSATTDKHLLPVSQIFGGQCLGY
nr:dynein axonemal intermediate chain 1-like [Cherax quadricarinatus]XP_053642158.1 dynein axonemal intermediate chain 1-like [Cherax quadricarinatus]